MKLTIMQSKGFNLIELLITIAIIAVLAVIAIPSYQNYTKRVYFNEVIQDTDPFKAGVIACYQAISTLTGCDGDVNHVPTNITTAKGALASITVTNGVITATPVAKNGISSSDTYILTPTVQNNALTWTVSGGCVTGGYC